MQRISIPFKHKLENFLNFKLFEYIALTQSIY